MKTAVSRSVSTLVAAFLTFAALPPLSAQSAQRLTGTLVDPAHLVLGFDSGKIDIRLTGTTADTVLAGFAGVTREKGEQALFQEVSKLELGRVSVDNGLGRPVAIVQESRQEGIRHLLIVVPRDLSVQEMFDSGRKRYYPYLVIEARFDADGNGDGELYPLAKLKISPDGRLSYESLSALPMQILRLQAS